MGRMFGTDGVRGVANADLSSQLAMDIGKAAGMIIKREKGARPLFLVGKDTRISGAMLESAVAAGLCAAGADVRLLGVVPTPAVAYLVKELGADAGVMLTASHNPFEYNGIKIFNGLGFKLSDEDEEEIEAIVLDGAEPIVYAAAEEIGTVEPAYAAVERYIAHIRSTIAGNLSGLRVAIDCSNGSASRTAAEIFENLGAQITILNAEPDGINVNRDCGSMHVETLAKYVRENGFDAGLAFDGDADRCLAVDADGSIVDGDHMLCIFATALKERGKLTGNTMVGTVMSNLGFFRYGEAHSIEACATKVGDRYVLEKMLAEGYAIGGEQSGHLIFLEHMTTGDGQLSGLQLLHRVSEAGKPLSALAGAMQKFPQVSVNVHADKAQKERLPDAREVWLQVQHYEHMLGHNGRILIRPSGTEPLVRVMVEGADKGEIEKIAQSLAHTIEEAL